MQVRTVSGWVVPASDASRYYENYRSGKPFPIVVDLGGMLNGFGKLRELARSDDHIIHGHDLLVRALYPPLIAGNDRIVQLHASPKL